MKINVQPSQRVAMLELSPAKIDKFACLFFILGMVIAASLLHQFIFKY